MQGRNGSQKQNPSAPGHASSAAHTPQQWFRSSSNRSVPNLAKSQHQNRLLGFSSIRDLAKTARQPLATLPTNISQPPKHTLRASNSLYGTLRDQCSPPPPSAPEPSAPPALVLRRSQSSGDSSLTPDQSGISTDSNHPTTPLPAKPSAFYEPETGSNLSPKSMGNKTSSIARKPLSLTGKRSVARLDEEEERSSESLTNDLEIKPPATFSPRGSPLIVKVPRRRSSLTVLHLNNSHFDTPDPKPPSLHRSASTLTEPLERRPSTLAGTLKPAISNVSTITPLNVAQNRETTLSPPLLSPTSRISSVSSQAPSMASPLMNSRSSVIGARIHLPKTFPGGPVPVLAPPLTQTHHQCYTGHKRILPSKNSYCPVPCMACTQHANEMWKCTFCMLRICPQCMTEFEVRKRKLGDLLGWLAKGKDKDEEGMKEVVSDRVRIEDFALKNADGSARGEIAEKAIQELTAKKTETARKRETR